MGKRTSPIQISRCALTGEEYLRVNPAQFTNEAISRLSIEEFRDVLILALKEMGHHVYPADTPPGFGNDDFFLLESQKVEPRIWSVKSWSLFGCYRRKSPVEDEEALRFNELIISDGAQGGTIITTGRFTEQARTVAEERGIALIDCDNLREMLLKASSHGPYSPACMALSEELMEELLSLKRKVHSLGEVGNQITGKWTAPLHMDKIIKSLVDRILTTLSSTPRTKTEALEKGLISQIQRLSDDISKLESDFSELDTVLSVTRSK